MSREAVQLQPAYLLHQRPYRDSSRIVDCFCRDHGRVPLVARGARRPRSSLRSVLQPFQPILVSWVRRGELGTLTAAETAGPPSPLTGDGLLSGFYINELLLRLLDGGEAQEALFAGYAEALRGIVDRTGRDAALRRFEMRLLDALGYGLVLDHEAHSSQALAADGTYEYHPQAGPRRVHGVAEGGAAFYSGSVLAAIANEQFDRPEVLRAARRILRQALDLYLDGRPLRVRSVARAMRRDKAPPGTREAPR